MAENIVGRSFARDAFTQAFSAKALVRPMLDFERVLASARDDVGAIPKEASRVIAKASRLESEARDAGQRGHALGLALVRSYSAPASTLTPRSVRGSPAPAGAR
jgi:adenylosuccinate lyase